MKQWLFERNLVLGFIIFKGKCDALFFFAPRISADAKSNEIPNVHPPPFFFLRNVS